MQDSRTRQSSNLHRGTFALLTKNKIKNWSPSKPRDFSTYFLRNPSVPFFPILTILMDLCSRKTQPGNNGYRDAIVFEKFGFQNVFCPQENAKLAFSNSSGLKSVFKKLCFRDRLVKTVGLSSEIKMCF